jgi:hypothetical protein
MDSDYRHPGPEGPTVPGAEPGEDVLHRLEQRLDRASEAAELLISEAAAAAVRKPPPSGWQPPEPEPEPEPGQRAAPGTSEIELLLGAIHALRDRIPPELQHRLGVALREVLLALRALIDWYLERGQRPSQPPSEVQDIPIL